MRARLFLLLSLASTIAALPAAAQDTHYWTNQYGPRAMMLGGAVLGSITDMSATYYNPGALGYIEKPELLLSANVYRGEKITVKDGAGEGFDLDTTEFSPLPNMLAGALRSTWLGQNKVAYSLLTRQRLRAEVQGSRVGKEDVLPSPGDEDFAGSISIENNVNDLWAGVTWAHGGLGRKAGFGVTTYLSIRNQDRMERALGQAKGADDFALIFDVDQLDYSSYSLLWKAGVGFDLRPLSAGITLTTPRLRVSGSGSASTNVSAVNVDVTGDGMPDTTFVTDIQEDVKATYKTPLSIGAGLAYKIGRSRIHFSIEWFDKVEPYDVLELSSFVSQANGETVQPEVRHALKSITNWGLGIEHDINETWRWYLSFITDRSASDDRSDISVTPYDLYHVAGGSTFGLGRTELTLGLGYGWGSEEITQLIDLDPDSGGDPIDPSDRVSLEYQGVTFIVGFQVQI